MFQFYDFGYISTSSAFNITNYVGKYGLLFAGVIGESSSSSSGNVLTVIIPAWLLSEGRVFENGAIYTTSSFHGIAFKFTNNTIKFVQLYSNGVQQSPSYMYLWYFGLK